MPTACSLDSMRTCNAHCARFYCSFDLVLNQWRHAIQTWHRYYIYAINTTHMPAVTTRFIYHYGNYSPRV